VYLATASLALLGFAGVVIWRPVAGHAITHNVLVLALLLTGCVSLSLAALKVHDAASWTAFTVHAVLIGFLLRAMPVLMFTYPPNHDGYFYFVSALNVIDAHRIEPVLQAWYSGVEQQLQWPMLQLLTAQVHLWTGIPATDLWRFLPPALGSLTYLAVALVARAISNSWAVSAVAGILAVFADLVVFYQSDYHPQGLAILSGIFFLYLVLASRRTGGLGIRVLLIAAGAFFLFTHHGSALLVPFVLLPLLVVPFVARAVGLREHIPGLRGLQMKRDGQLLAQMRGMSRFSTIIVLLSVAAIAMHVYLSDAILALAIRSIDPSIARNPTDSGGLVWWIVVLRTVKYVLLVVALMGVALTIKRPSADRLVLLVVLAGATAAGLTAALLAPDGATRLLALWLPWAGLFAAIALVWLVRARARIGPGLATAALTAFLFAGVLNSQIPAYFLEGSPRSPVMFYGNALPDSEAVAAAGEWLRVHTPVDAIYAVDFATRMAPFYFAGRSDQQLIYAVEAAAYCRADYLVVDYGLDQEGLLAKRVPLDYRRLPKLYDNGMVAVFDHRAAGSCP
jgi:hypothetical protein